MSLENYTPTVYVKQNLVRSIDTFLDSEKLYPPVLYDDTLDSKFISDRLLIYTYFSFYCTRDNKEIYTSFKKILPLFGVKKQRDYKKTKGYKRICNVLDWFVQNQYIEGSYKNARYDTMLEFTFKDDWYLGLGEENKVGEAFVKLNLDEFNQIISIKNKDTASLLHTFLYIKSKIQWRQKYPKIALVTQANMTKDLKILQPTICDYTKVLCKEKLLHRRKLIKSKYSNLQYIAPYIYTSDEVVNNPTAELQKGVDYFIEKDLKQYYDVPKSS